MMTFSNNPTAWLDKVDAMIIGHPLQPKQKQEDTKIALNNMDQTGKSADYSNRWTKI